ncbi:MAG: T9SS type A sorting domain-containing protein [Flavobacteriales bacterium]|nr:T9SS type A sorting domain-containing protein [Flavobacteriales bacterium]
MIFRPAGHFLSIVLLPAATAQAQLPVVDITHHMNASDQVEIYVRPDGAFDEVFSSSVFTLRWLDADGANLGGIQQVVPTLQYQTVAKSGAEQVSGPYRYQIFTGFGLMALFDLETSWGPFEEILLCRVNVINGMSTFELVNDAWTQTNNGNFYVSLNGVDRTGQIYTFTTVEEGIEGMGTGGVRIMPNPGTGPFQVLTDMADAGTLEFELTDGLGRVVRLWSEAAGQGTHRTVVDLAGHTAGTYLLTVRGATRLSSHRIVLTRD